MKRALRVGGWVVVFVTWAATGCSDGALSDGAKIMQIASAEGRAAPVPKTPVGLDTINSPACVRPAHLSRHGQAPPTGTVHVVPVFWNTGVDPTIQSSIQTSMRTFAGSDEVRWLKKEYSMPAMTVDTPITILPVNTITSLMDTNIQNELQLQITNPHSVLPPAGEQTLYVVHLPPTVSVQNQCSLFCGYNSLFIIPGTTTRVHYAVMPDFAHTQCSNNECGATPTNWYPGFTSSESHEIAEAILSGPSSWEDRSQSFQACGHQIGDLCNGFDSDVSLFPFPGTTRIQWMWSNSANRCQGANPGAQGDIDGDGFADLALTGGISDGVIPIAIHQLNTGSFTVNSANVGSLITTTAAQGTMLFGDFDGDGLSDLAVTGAPGLSSVPVMFSKGNNTFDGRNIPIANFGQWAASGLLAAPVSGDFDGDGRTDIALAGGPGWNTIPVAFSNGDGSFRVTNLGNLDFENLILAADITPQMVSGDFDGDGRSDLALVGGTDANSVTWTYIVIATSNGDGTFTLHKPTMPNFPTWAMFGHAVAGDFDGDGRADIALAGGSGWNTVPIAYSNADGTFTETNVAYPSFPADAQAPGARLLAADINGDGNSDLILVGGAGWTTIDWLSPTGRGGGSVFGRPSAPDLARLSSTPGVNTVTVSTGRTW